MDVFYNRKGIGDVLIFPLEAGDRDQVQSKMHGDVVEITDRKGNILGYNIFHASRYFSLDTSGRIPLSEKLLNKIRQVFEENGIQNELQVDLSPKFVVGYVKEKTQHENADKLSVCQVDVGEETLQIVCGAPNVEKGQKVVVAKVGAVMPNGLKIKQTELRGVPSNGMICSQKELGLPNASNEKGIYVLDHTYQTGEPFEF